MINNESFLSGTFVKELNNRFLCEVIIDGVSVVCYVPSSCHLGNFLNLRGKTVVLRKNANSRARTQYAVFAVPFKRSYIMLNTSEANRAFEACIRSRCFSYLGKRNEIVREHVINGYKCDFFLEKTNTVIEIKSLISTNRTAIFPTVYSERTIAQMNIMRQLLDQGFKVFLFIVSMNPYVNEVVINQKTDFFSALLECQKAGLQIKACTTRLLDGKLKVDRHIPVRYFDEKEQIDGQCSI